MTANNKDKRKRTKKSGVFKRLEQKRINKIKREFFERIKPVILDIQSNMSEPIKPAVWIKNEVARATDGKMTANTLISKGSGIDVSGLNRKQRRALKKNERPSVHVERF